MVSTSPLYRLIAGRFINPAKASGLAEEPLERRRKLDVSGVLHFWRRVREINGRSSSGASARAH